jgi:hypothetical protein
VTDAVTATETTFRTPEGREIQKQPVIAHALVARTHGGSSADYITHIPITGENTLSDGVHDGTVRGLPGNGDAGLVNVGEDEELVEIVPAEPGTFMVMGWDSDDDPETGIYLGYEYPGASNPDWDTVIENVREHRETRPEAELIADGGSRFVCPVCGDEYEPEYQNREDAPPRSIGREQHQTGICSDGCWDGFLNGGGQ